MGAEVEKVALRQVAPISARLVAIATIDLVVGILAFLSLFYMPNVGTLFGIGVLSWIGLLIAITATITGILGILAGYGIMADIILGTMANLFRIKMTKYFAYFSAFLCLIAFLISLAQGMGATVTLFYLVLTLINACLGYFARNIVGSLSGTLSLKLTL